MDALELALKCSSLLIRSMSSKSGAGQAHQAGAAAGSTDAGTLPWNEADFKDHSDFADDTSHTDENDLLDGSRGSGCGGDFAMVGIRRKRTEELDMHSDGTDNSDGDELRSLEEDDFPDFPVETTYVVQQEEEFGSVNSSDTSGRNFSLFSFI